MDTNDQPERKPSGEHDWSTAELRERERRDELTHAQANLLQVRLLEEGEGDE